MSMTKFTHEGLMESTYQDMEDRQNNPIINNIAVDSGVFYGISTEHQVYKLNGNKWEFIGPDKLF